MIKIIRKQIISIALAIALTGLSFSTVAAPINSNNKKASQQTVAKRKTTAVSTQRKTTTARKTTSTTHKRTTSTRKKAPARRNTLTATNQEIVKYYPSFAQASKTAQSQHLAMIRRHPTKSNDIWKNLAKEFSMPHYADSPAVQRQINLLLAHKKFFEDMARQSEPYIYYIEQQVKKKDVPMELALLPMIESAYDPFAHSWVGAAGLWQFMPRTATEVGIKQNWWYDGRRDVLTSTDGALAYLNSLNKNFKGNWLHAIAAYNSGAGTVQKAIRQNKNRGANTEFWALSLPKQTENYVPRLLAVAEIVSNPKAYGVNLSPVKAQPYFTEVDVGQQIDLQSAAKLAEIKLNELYQLNPGYSRWTTDPAGPHKLLIPITKAKTFKTNLAHVKRNRISTVSKSHSDGKASKRYTSADGVTYTVRRGDTLGKIAQRNHVKLATLKRNNHLSSNSIRTGQVLLLSTQSVKSKPIAPASVPAPKPATPEIQINLAEYKTKITENAKNTAETVNKIINNQVAIQTAQLNKKAQLEIRKNEAGKKTTTQTTVAAKASLSTTVYRVKRGDTLGRIAIHHHVKLASLKKENNLRGNTIRIGQKIKITKQALITANVKPAAEVKKTAPAKNTTAATATLEKNVSAEKDKVEVAQNKAIQYRVRKGDSLYLIAKRHHMNMNKLIRDNQLNKKKLLRPGQMITIAVAS